MRVRVPDGATRLYVARRSPAQDSGYHLVVVRDSGLPVAVRYASVYDLYRGARRILKRVAAGKPPLSATRRSHCHEDSQWAARLGRRLDCELLHNPSD